MIDSGPARLKRWFRRKAGMLAQAGPERPKFVVASLPRSGSTAVYRVLKSDPSVSIAYEPPFFAVGADPAKAGKSAARLLRDFGGIKHVWDPNGWPFANPDHVSTPEILARSEELIVPNRAILDRAERIVVLRRRNAFDRTLSDLWGQQTNLWGHAPERPYDTSEVPEYRAAVRRHVPAAIDPELFGWYMRHAESWEDAIVAGLPPSTVKTFLYEDLFGADRPDGHVPAAWYELTGWLGVKPDLASPEVRQIIAPSAKLNSAEVYERIPNYRELKAAFGGAGDE